MGAKIQAFDIFQTPLSSHYPLPLRAFSLQSSNTTRSFSYLAILIRVKEHRQLIVAEFIDL
jgi:hypothetical protein